MGCGTLGLHNDGTRATGAPTTARTATQPAQVRTASAETLTDKS